MRGSNTVDDAAAIARNVRIHDRISRDYERRHGEIFNELEQARLIAALREAAADIQSSRIVKRALDFGCGSGNLTSYLIAMGMETVSADVSPGFLELIRHKFASSGRSTTAQLNGRDLTPFADGELDFVVTYSVLHHVPDYLGIVREMCRVLAPGGVLYIDHENNDEFWRRTSPAYRELQALTIEPRWRRFLRPSKYLRLVQPSWYLTKLRRLRDARYSPEGDIHVWPDDHVEWSAVAAVVRDAGLTVLREEDYLLYQTHYPRDLYERYRSRCTDVRLLVARKTR